MRYTALLFSCLLAGCCLATSNGRSIDVATTYGVGPADGAKRIGEHYTAGADTMPGGLYFAWQRMKQRMDHAQWRTMYLGWGILQDVAWYQEYPHHVRKNLQNTYSFGDWSGAPGRWLVNATAQLPRAGMVGASSFGYAGQGNDHGYHATEFVMADAEWWPADAQERRLLESPNTADRSTMGYNESFRLEGFRLTGPGLDDGVQRIGLFIARAGEASWVNQVRSDGFSIGIAAQGGVPLTVGTVSVFRNHLAGFAGLGSALATISIQTLSGDANGCLLGLLRYGVDPPGGNVQVGLMKYEDGVTDGMAMANGVAVQAEGQYALNIGMISFANGAAAEPEAVIRVLPTLGHGAHQASLISATVVGFGYRVLLHNELTGAMWASPGDYAAIRFDHYAKGDAFSSAIPGSDALRILRKTAAPGTLSGGTEVKVVTSFRAQRSEGGTAALFDGDQATRWTSGGAPKAGDRLELDLGERLPWHRIVLDARCSPGDMPEALAVSVSNDGKRWVELSYGSVVVLNAAETIIRSAVPRTERYVRITTTTAHDRWWSIHELRVE